MQSNREWNTCLNIQYLEMFGLKLNEYMYEEFFTHLQLWVA